MAVRERSRCGATVLHSGHGTQFTSWSWGENLRRSGLTPSFGSVGDCFDNAVIEAFWGRMQVELLNTKRWATTFELVVAMANWIDTFYNTDRVHSYIGNISPDQYEALWALTLPCTEKPSRPTRTRHPWPARIVTVPSPPLSSCRLTRDFPPATARKSKSSSTRSSCLNIVRAWWRRTPRNGSSAVRGGLTLPPSCQVYLT